MVRRIQAIFRLVVSALLFSVALSLLVSIGRIYENLKVKVFKYVFSWLIPPQPFFDPC